MTKIRPLVGSTTKNSKHILGVNRGYIEDTKVLVRYFLLTKKVSSMRMKFKIKTLSGWRILKSRRLKLTLEDSSGQTVEEAQTLIIWLNKLCQFIWRVFKEGIRGLGSN